MKVKMLEAGSVGFPRHRIRNPIYGGQVYAYHQPLYGYYGVVQAAALTRQTVFSVAQGGNYTPAGGTQVALTEWHTNMIKPNELPNPDRHFVKYIAVKVRENIQVTDAIRFLNDSLIVFFMGSQSLEYWRCHGNRTPAGGGVFGFSSAIVQNGLPESMNQVPFWGPPDAFGIVGAEVIEQGQNFGVTIDPTRVSDNAGNTIYTTAATAAGGVGIDVFIYLDGIRVRGMQ